MIGKKILKVKIIAGILALILLLSLFGLGSDVIDNYTPDGGVVVSPGGDIKEIEYNYDVLDNVTGGYSGPPKLVASDDKVFYIPPEYCDGSYLKNFRVIGINQSNAKITKDGQGNITDYEGAVVLYGFQTTYREDYGTDYDFEYEPYDYNVEYDVVDSYFNDVILGKGDADKYKTEETEGGLNGENVSGSIENSTETTTFNLFMPGTVSTKENKDAVDDSDFKVATVVMEHEIGKDQCKILYCDAGSATVSDLDVGKYNLVTNLNDSALTVCYNENMYVYSFNEEDSSYGSNEVYYYKLQDLFNSITFKNTLSDAGYCNVSYSVKGDISVEQSDDGWVNVWTSKMSKSNSTNVKNVSYLSNLVGDTASKDKINADFIDMEAFIKKEIENAYSGYKKEPSGWLSYEHSTSLENFGNYSYVKDGTNSWTLENTFKLNLEETSWNIIFPTTYKGSVTGKVTVKITPDFSLKSEYDYTINDLLLTKYANTGDKNEYSIIMQMLITPKENSSEEETMEPITDFDAYVEDINNRAPYEDSTPEGVDERELEAMENDSYDESYTESEEYIEREISAKYITLNINLSQLNGTESASDIEVISISNTAEINDYFNRAKEKYKAEYDNGIKTFSTEEKTGPYVNPKDYTIESINDFKDKFKEINDCYIELEKAKTELSELESEFDAISQYLEDNSSTTNELADKLTGDLEITDKTVDESGFYTGLNQKMEALDKLFGEDVLNYDTNTIIKQYIDFKGNADNILSSAKKKQYVFFNSIHQLDKEISKYESLLLNMEDCYPGFCNELETLKEIDVEKIIEDGSIGDISFTNIINMDKYADELYTQYTDNLYNSVYINSVGMRNTLFPELEHKYFVQSYNTFSSSLNNIAEYADVLENDLLPFIRDENGKAIINKYKDRASLIYDYNQYQYSLIPEKQAQVTQLEERLKELKAQYDSTDFYVDLSWNGERLNSDALIKYHSEYDNIISNADEYISAYQKLVNVSDYRDSADKFISNIVTLNTDENISRIIDKLLFAVPEEYGVDKYGTAYNSLVFLRDNKNRFFADISSSINNLAGIKTSEVAETDRGEQTNTNIDLIEDYTEKFYGSMGINAVKSRTYSQVMQDCQNIYNALYDSFSKITIQVDGEDKVLCDVKQEDVENCVYTLLMDKYEIYELSDYNSDGTVAKTVTLAKGQPSQGNVYEETEVSTEVTTEAIYKNSLDAVYSSHASLSKYATELNNHYKAIKQIAIDKLLDSGCLTDEQKEIISNNQGSVDDDITSDYNIGYYSALTISDEMIQLLDQAKTYYEVREEAAGEIRSAAVKGLVVELRDDVYYTNLYKEKCTQADHLYRLLYNVAGARNEEEKNKYIEEYKSIDWIVDDLQVKEDLSSAIVITRKTLSTTYQKVDWNTSLIRADKESNVSGTPYELYQMNSNFCIGISDNDGFIVPMGTQSDIDVKSINAKIDQEIQKSGITEINNVAYGYNNGYDILLFSSDTKWFMIVFRQTQGSVSVDINNVLGYSGNYSVDGDPHFLEYDHTNVTGVNQLFSTTIENGYMPYSIELKGNRNGVIKAEEKEEDSQSDTSDEATGMEGAFFNSWSDDKGNVILLGFKKEDMEVVEEDNESTTEFYYDGETETTTTEKQYRKIADTDIYDAHLYVLQYDVKKSEGDRNEGETDYLDTDAGKLFDAGIRLEGPYGELLEPAVNILTVARGAVIAIVYSLAILYSVYLGTKLSRAGNEEERRKAKDHIKWFVIAVIGTHVLIAFLYLAAAELKRFDDEVQIISGTDITETTDTQE